MSESIAIIMLMVSPFIGMHLGGYLWRELGDY